MTNDREASVALQRLLGLGAMASTSEPSAAADALSDWIRRRDLLATNCSSAEAFSAVGDLLAIARRMAEPLMHRAFDGEDHRAVHLLRSLQPQDPDTERSGRLRLLALKLKLAARFLDSENAAMPLSNAVTELAAVNAGDEPRLFAPIESKRSKGLGSNAYRLAISQLRALEWDAVLAARGNSASDRHLILHQAFGVQWDAIRKWPEPCTKRLGATIVTRSLELARDTANAGQPVFGEVYGLSLADAVIFDGRLYQAELRRRKS